VAKAVEEVLKKQTELLRRIAKSEEDSAFFKEITDAHANLDKTSPVATLPLPIPTPYGMLFTLPVPLPSPQADPIPLPFPRLQTL
jgi:hypothetical protein